MFAMPHRAGRPTTRRILKSTEREGRSAPLASAFLRTSGKQVTTTCSDVLADRKERDGSPVVVRRSHGCCRGLAKLSKYGVSDEHDGYCCPRHAAG
jgi:hypothetical protein